MMINYNLLFFSAEDLARHNAKAGYLILGDDVAWEDFYAHMKIKACDQLFQTNLLSMIIPLI